MFLRVLLNLFEFFIIFYFYGIFEISNSFISHIWPLRNKLSHLIFILLNIFKQNGI